MAYRRRSRGHLPERRHRLVISNGRARQRGHDVRTFTVGFEEIDYDERPYARQVASLFATRHTERTVGADDVEEVFRETILWHYDEPFGDYSYLPTYYVCREARSAITVALTGDGGDELFSGYGKYAHLARRAQFDRAVAGSLTQLLASGARAVLPSGELQNRVRRYEQTSEELLLGMLRSGPRENELQAAARGSFATALESYDAMDTLRPHLARAPVADVGIVNAMRYLDVKLTLAAGILVKVDRASMAVSLETRPPYLNRAVLDVAGRIPPRKLATAKEPKAALRDALRPWLPPTILDRPKMGFGAPLGRWLRGDLTALAEKRPSSALDELIDPACVSAVARAHSAGENRTTELHNLIFLDHWLQKWW